MNVALFRKTLRDSAFLLTLATLAIATFEVLAIQAFHYAVPNPQLYFSRVPPFMAQFINVLAGMDMREALTPTGLMAIGFNHPFVHIVLWSHTIAYTTRVLVGEIDRGTADLLHSLPLSRSRIYVTLTLLWLFAGVLLTAAPCVGTWFAQEAYLRGPFEMDRLAMVCANLFVLYVAIGAGAMLVSAAFSRRGPAVGLLAALLLASFVLNFLAAIWTPARRIAFLGILDYYKPLPTIVTGRWPAHDLGALALAAVVCWLAGLVVYSRRDLRTG